MMSFNSKRCIPEYFQKMFLLIILSSCVCHSAITVDLTGKKLYNPELDTLWSRDTYILCLSNDGNWVVFKEDYDIKKDVITLMNTADSVYFRLSDGEHLNFSNDNKWFGYISSDKDLMLYNLEDHTIKARQDISSYNFNYAGDHIAAVRMNQDAAKSLLIAGLKDNAVFEMKGICEYKWHPRRDLIAVSLTDSSSSQIILYNVSTHRQNVLCKNEKSSYSGLLWSDTGNSLLFFEQSGDKNQLHFYSLNDTVRSLSDASLEKMFPNSTLSNRTLSISDDGKTVFFYREIKGYRIKEQNFPEIWDTDDPWIYPRMKAYNKNERSFLLTAWDTRSGRLYGIADEETPTVQFNPDFQHALVYNKLVYEPQYKQYEDVDLYLKDFDTGKKLLIVQKQYTYPGFITFSPKGRYVAYFRDSDWWVYDSESKQNINLVGSFRIGFQDQEDSPKTDKEPYGNPGWTEDEKYIILYDRYDIWLITPDGKHRQKVTNGREQRIRYRISRYAKRNDQNYVDLLTNNSGIGFNLKQVIILEMEGDDLQTGYAIWKYGSDLETLIYGPWKTDLVLMSGDQGRIVFKKCRFNEPPAIFALNLANNETRLLYQSNKKLLDYDLGRDELVKFGSGNKGSLKGVIIYPADFDPERKYPMIVCIYEKNSNVVNSFAPPSEYEYSGFNILKYVTNGYFVLLPDIEYSIRNPGISSLKSVTGLVRKVLRYEYIDKSRIGLIGHSFGGYEAAFIATQTGIFRTVVAGATVTDLISWYHDIQGNGWDTEQMWRLENHQFRMGGSFYDLKKQYYRNSPLHYVEKLDVPLLLWAGKEDYNINWYQSIYMFMAMKRLKKEGKLLLFNSEGHNLINPDNQEKLSEEVFNWFNHYLKEERSE